MKKKVLSLALALVLCLGLAIPAFAAEDQSVEYLEFKVSVKNALSREEKDIVTGPWDNIELTYVTIHADKNSTVSINDSPVYAAAMCGQGEDGPRSYVKLEAGVEYTGEELCRMARENARDPEWASGNFDSFIFGYDMVDGDSGGFLTFCTVLFDIEKSAAAETEKPTEPQSTPDAPGSYTVKKGDTWSTICTNFYGTNAQRYALMKANKSVKLVEGTVITLPEKLGKDVLIAAPVCGEGEKLYTVKAGDTLGKIALAEYGKMGEYKAIFERNADRLKNANTIYEGQVIVLPVLSK